MKNETVIRFRAIMKRHEANNAENVEPVSDQYYTEHARIQVELTKFIRNEVFAALPKREILTLVYLCYRYNCMPLHNLGIVCEKQALLLKP